MRLGIAIALVLFAQVGSADGAKGDGKILGAAKLARTRGMRTSELKKLRHGAPVLWLDMFEVYRSRPTPIARGKLYFAYPAEGEVVSLSNFELRHIEDRVRISKKPTGRWDFFRVDEFRPAGVAHADFALLEHPRNPAKAALPIAAFAPDGGIFHVPRGITSGRFETYGSDLDYRGPRELIYSVKSVGKLREGMELHVDAKDEAARHYVQFTSGGQTYHNRLFVHRVFPDGRFLLRQVWSDRTRSIIHHGVDESDPVVFHAADPALPFFTNR